MIRFANSWISAKQSSLLSWPSKGIGAVTSWLSYLEVLWLVPHHVPSRAGCTLQHQGLGIGGLQGWGAAGAAQCPTQLVPVSPASPPQGTAELLSPAGGASGKICLGKDKKAKQAEEERWKRGKKQQSEHQGQRRSSSMAEQVFPAAPRGPPPEHSLCSLWRTWATAKGRWEKEGAEWNPYILTTTPLLPSSPHTPGCHSKGRECNQWW